MNQYFIMQPKVDQRAGQLSLPHVGITKGNSKDKLRHPIYDAYSAEQVLLHKQQIWCSDGQF